VNFTFHLPYKMLKFAGNAKLKGDIFAARPAAKMKRKTFLCA
jgi:hypothetical protein